MAGVTKGIRGLSLMARQWLNKGGNIYLYTMSFPMWDQLECPAPGDNSKRYDRQWNRLIRRDRIIEHDQKLMFRHARIIQRRQAFKGYKETRGEY